MNTRRKLIIASGTGALLAPFGSFAQQKKIYRVGILSTTNAANSPNFRAFLQGMEKLGWIEGQNISIEHRFAEGNVDRLPALAADLVQRKVDVIITFNGIATQAAKQVTGTIPIVFATVHDPVGRGLVTSLARPGGNMTGNTSIGEEIIAKRVELLKEINPKISRIAVIKTSELSDASQMAEVQRAATTLKIEVVSIEIRNRNDLAVALALLHKWRADSIFVLDSSINFYNREFLAKFAVENRLPMIASFKRYVESGALISYGPDYEELSRSAATFVDKIFKGASPAEIPVERPTKFELVINMKTAKALGIKIPQSILVQATKVIE